MATKLPNGKYRSQVLLGKDAAGKRLYRSFTADSAEKADFLALEHKIKNEKRTVASRTVEECVKEYIDVRETAGLSPSTIDGYRNKARNTFQSVMKINILKLTNADLQLAANSDLKTKAIKTVKDGWSIVRGAVKPFVNFNPEINFPRVENPERKIPHTTPDKAALAKIIKAAYGTRLEVPIFLAAWLSYRESEVCGIRWSDYQNGMLYLRQARVYAAGKDHVKTTKTKSSERTLEVPKRIADALKRHRKDYDSEFIYAPSPHSLSKAYIKFIKKLDVPYHSFHDLRAANASLMLLIMPDQYAKKRGGWRSSAVLKKHYQGTFTPEEIEFADRFNAMIEADIMANATENATQRANTTVK